MAQLAYLFPGQGAQAVGMGKAFYDRFDEAKEVYRKAGKRLGFDVAALCFEGPQEELTKTERCQPALFVTSLAAFAALQRAAPSLKPIGAAGLSLGELTALAAAQALSLEDGCYLVKARGEAMAECAARTRGAMVAIMGASPDGLERLCRASGASPANYNTPEQVVLSGPVEAIEQAERLAKEHGAKRAIRLEVAGAFHSPLMQPAADAVKQVLAGIELRPPVFPVFSNVTAAATQDPEAIRTLLIRQITSPVRWEPSIRALLAAGATHFLEFPPAKVLTGMLRKIDPAATGLTLDDPQDLDKLQELISQIPKS